MWHHFAHVVPVIAAGGCNGTSESAFLSQRRTMESLLDQEYLTDTLFDLFPNFPHP